MFSDSIDLRNTLNVRIKTSMQRQTTYKILGLKIKASKKKIRVPKIGLLICNTGSYIRDQCLLSLKAIILRPVCKLFPIYNSLFRQHINHEIRIKISTDRESVLKLFLYTIFQGTTGQQSVSKNKCNQEGGRYRYSKAVRR